MTMQWGTAGSFPAEYERLNVTAFFRVYAEDLVGRLGLADGERLLDVATGTGIIPRVARAAVPGLARVAGLDMTPGMLAVAADVSAGLDVDWVEGDATHMPFENGSFDAISCQQGLQFVPDREAALAEMLRVAGGGGRIAISCWGPIERQVVPSALVQAAASLLPDVGGVTSAPFSLHGDTLTALVVGAGFTDVETAEVQLDAHYGSAEDAVQGFASGSPLALVLPTLDAEAVDQWQTEAEALLHAHETSDGLKTAMVTTVVTALAP